MNETLQIVNELIEIWKSQHHTNVTNIYTEVRNNMVIIKDVTCINTSMIYHIPYKLKIRVVPNGNSFIDIYCKIFNT